MIDDDGQRETRGKVRPAAARAVHVELGCVRADRQSDITRTRTNKKAIQVSCRGSGHAVISREEECGAKESAGHVLIR
eukprot:6251449-Prymnesium_polylepis.1